MPGTKNICAAVCIFLAVSGCAQAEGREQSPASLSVPGVAEGMKSADFWVARLPSPDAVILSPEKIRSLNTDIELRLKLTHRVAFMAPAYSGAQLRSEIAHSIASLSDAHLYRGDESPADDTFFKSIKDASALERIPDEIKVGYGFIIRNADERIIPTDEGLYAKLGDHEFDEAQNSGLDIGSPVAILHTSADGAWVYIENDLSSGWVKRDAVESASKEEIRRCANSAQKVIVISRTADIFLSEDLTRPYSHARMGVSFASSGRDTSDALGILLPVKNSEGKLEIVPGYMLRRDVSPGYLTYTPRTIMVQAFKLLDAPYGWGDREERRDCSRFIQELFATVGIRMPRNSDAQSEVGSLIGEYGAGGEVAKKIEALKAHGMGGVTTLRLKGHIMLYLGDVDGVPYAIHAFWAYNTPGFINERTFVVGRVAVTDLFLGKGSRKGSLLERIVTMRNVG